MLAIGTFALGIAPEAQATVVTSTYDQAPPGVTGGAGRTVRTVTTLADGGTGSLRAVLAAGGGDVRFATGLSGDLRLASLVKVPSNTTISGAGAKVTVVGRGLLVDGVSNVVIQRVAFRGVTGDAVSVTSSSHVWVNHVDFDGTGAVDPDGLLDVTRGSTAVTISWNRFVSHDKVMLLGASTADGTPALVDMTLHHNLVVGTVQRNPLMRHGRFNLYNNVLDGWGRNSVNTDGYGMKAECGAYARVEANIFRPRVNLRGSFVTDGSGCASSRLPAVDLVANQANGATLVERDPAAVQVAAAQVQPADSALEQAVRGRAGNRSAGEATPTTVTTSPSTTTAPAASGTPVVALRATGPDKLEVSWQPIAGATSYRWSIKTCTGTNIVTSETTATVKTRTGLAPGCYVAMVNTVNPTGPIGTSSQTQLGAATPSTTTTTAPTTAPTTTLPKSIGTPVVSLRPLAADKLEVTWQPIAGATSYRWTINTCAGVQVSVSETTATLKTKSGLLPGCYVATVRTSTPLGPIGTSPQVRLG